MILGSRKRSNICAIHNSTYQVHLCLLVFVFFFGVVVELVQEGDVLPDDARPVQDVVDVIGPTLGEFQDLVVRLHKFDARRPETRRLGGGGGCHVEVGGCSIPVNLKPLTRSSFHRKAVHGTFLV